MGQAGTLGIEYPFSELKYPKIRSHFGKWKKSPYTSLKSWICTLLAYTLRNTLSYNVSHSCFREICRKQLMQKYSRGLNKNFNCKFEGKYLERNTKFVRDHCYENYTTTTTTTHTMRRDVSDYAILVCKWNHGKLHGTRTGITTRSFCNLLWPQLLCSA